MGVLFGSALSATGLVFNKYQESEKKLNGLYVSLRGQEENFAKANEVAGLLMEEMKASKVESVRLSGTGHPNNKIEILRTFLTNHLNSKVGHKYVSREKILSEGVYTQKTLVEIMYEASKIEQHQEAKNVKEEK